VASLVLTPLNAAAILITLAAILSWVNRRFLKLPSSVGLALMGVAASLVTIALDAMMPSVPLRANAQALLANVDFHDTLMNGMLSFLLFAGALHVDLKHLARTKWQVLVLSTLGVVASTLLVGLGLFALAPLLGLSAPLVWCLPSAHSSARPTPSLCWA
jgi:CPA1 family monovalent cation:H+ antiporter